MAQFTQEQMDTLEAIVDASSLAAVLEGLSEVCHAKAEHIRSNWQDRLSACVWDAAGLTITKAATFADQRKL